MLILFLYTIRLINWLQVVHMDGTNAISQRKIKVDEKYKNLFKTVFYMSKKKNEK